MNCDELAAPARARREVQASCGIGVSGERRGAAVNGELGGGKVRDRPWRGTPAAGQCELVANEGRRRRGVEPGNEKADGAGAAGLRTVLFRRRPVCLSVGSATGVVCGAPPGAEWGDLA